MQVNKEFLKSLKPCADRYENYLRHHANFDGSLNDFLDLPSVSYEDKVWVAEKILTQNQAVSWCILCAESVLSIFESKHPDNQSLSKCINFLKSIKDFNNLTDSQSLEINRHIKATKGAGDFTAACFFESATLTDTDATDAATADAAYAVRCAALAARYAAHAAAGAANAVNYAARAALAANHATIAATDAHATHSSSYGTSVAKYTNHATIATTLAAARAASNSINDDAFQIQQALNLQFLKQVID